jgi:hypothetical protein
MSDNTDARAGFRTYGVRLLLFSIPVVNVVAALLWSFAGRDADTRSFGRAALTVVLVLTAVVVGAGLVSLSYLTSQVVELGG